MADLSKSSQITQVNLIYLPTIFVILLFMQTLLSSHVALAATSTDKLHARPLSESKIKLVESLFNQQLVQLVRSAEHHIQAISNSEIIYNYAAKPTDFNHRLIRDLFRAQINSFTQAKEISYSDKTGREWVRIVKPSGVAAKILPVNTLREPDEQKWLLQVRSLRKGDVWHSRIVPSSIESAEPTSQETAASALDQAMSAGNTRKHFGIIRFITPLYLEGNHEGFIHIDVSISELLAVTQLFPEFHFYLVDNDGHFIYHPHQQHRWGRYIKSEYTLYNQLPQHVNSILKQSSFSDTDKGVHAFLAAEKLSNQDQLRVILTANGTLQGSNASPLTPATDDTESSSVLTNILRLLVILGGLSLALYHLYQKGFRWGGKGLISSNSSNQSLLKMIDEHTLVYKINNMGIIIAVSSAYCDLTGRTRSELLGQDCSILFNDIKDYETLRSHKPFEQRGWTRTTQHRSSGVGTFWLSESIIGKGTANNCPKSITVIGHNTTASSSASKMAL